MAPVTVYVQRVRILLVAVNPLVFGDDLVFFERQTDLSIDVLISELSVVRLRSAGRVTTRISRLIAVLVFGISVSIRSCHDSSPVF